MDLTYTPAEAEFRSQVRLCRFNPHTSAAMDCIAARLSHEFSEAGVGAEGSCGMLAEEGFEAPACRGVR